MCVRPAAHGVGVATHRGFWERDAAFGAMRGWLILAGGLGPKAGDDPNKDGAADDKSREQGVNPAATRP